MLPWCICAEYAGAGSHSGRERRVRVGGAGAGDAARAAVRGGRSGSIAAYGGAALIVATVAGRRTLLVPLPLLLLLSLPPTLLSLPPPLLRLVV